MKLTVLCWMLAFVGGGTAAQGFGVPSEIDAPRSEARTASFSSVVTGRVCWPNGSPAVDAEVETSAGGRAVTAADGRFSLRIEVPLDAESVELTIHVPGTLGSPDGFASVRFVPSALAPTTALGRFVVEPSARFRAQWVPTFGTTTDVDGLIYAFAPFDDGSGPALYAGGAFTFAGGAEGNNIARWDGSRWSTVGSGANGWVLALAVWDDGSGPALYAAGDFTSMDGVAAQHVARWNGESWSAVGSGMSSSGASSVTVGALKVFDDGSGPRLYAAGRFDAAGGVPANAIAKWDGEAWSALDVPYSGVGIGPLEVYDGGSGPALYAGGSPIQAWNGTSWSPLPLNTASSVLALKVFDDGSGAKLYAGCRKETNSVNISVWDGSSWSLPGGDANHSVNAFEVMDDGTGPALYAGGRFTQIGGRPANRIARWNGTEWSGLNTGVGDANVPRVESLRAFEVGGQAKLFVSGSFGKAGNTLTRNFAGWDGTHWPALTRGLDGAVHVMAARGPGAKLDVAGGFKKAAGMPLQPVSRWEGSGWSGLGNQLHGGASALAWYDDGGGSRLYACGGITDGQVYEPRSAIARLDPSGWTFIGGRANTDELSGALQALVVHDDGSGPALYAGGSITTIGGITAFYIARWNGTSWSPVGGGMNFVVQALAVFDDGNQLDGIGPLPSPVSAPRRGAPGAGVPDSADRCGCRAGRPAGSESACRR